MFSEVTQTKSKSCFNSFRIVNTKHKIWGSRVKLSIFSLKTEILFQCLRLESKLFHKIIADGKNFEKVMLCLNKGNIALRSGSI